ncbi:MAG: glycosyltransferase family 4 protein [Paludibacteraceae bacterium]|nr:glycosyltransferase family 4 protein [Paludibacteraceae bacterium]
MQTYIIYSIIAVLLVVLELLYFRLAKRFGIIDKPNQRSSHNSVVLLGGGIIFLLSIWVWSAFFGIRYPWFLIGLTLVCGISFWDDIHSLPSYVRLIVHGIAVAFMMADLHLLFLDQWWIPLLVLILFVGIINAYNFMDGINGITASYSVAVLTPLIVLNYSLAFIEMSYLIVISIACLVFAFFNFRPRGKAVCFAGDVGSIGMAFILLLPIGKLILQTGDWTYIMLLAVYGVDTLLTIIHRIFLRENLCQAHRKHAYQIMANELHIPHEIVSIAYMAMQLIISFGLILISSNHRMYALCTMLVLGAAYLIFMKRYYHLHAEYINHK